MHKFYEGKVGMGILYIVLAFSIVGIPILGLCMLVDFLVLLFRENPYQP